MLAYLKNIIMDKQMNTIPSKDCSNLIICNYCPLNPFEINDNKISCKHLIESLQDGIWIIDADARTMFVNQSMANILGFEINEMLGKQLYTFIDKKDIEKCNSNLERRKKGISEQIEFELVRKNGEKIIANIKTSPVFDEERNYLGAIAVMADITEIKKTEQALKESEKKYKELFNNIRSGVAIYEAINNGEDFIFKDFNKAGEKIDNIKKKELIGKRVTQIFPGVKELGLFNVFKKVWRTGIPQVHPNQLYKDNRISHWVENYVYKLPTGDIVAVYDDVTERKKYEESIKESEEEFRNLFQNSVEAIYIIDPESKKIVDANNTFFTTLGYEKNELDFFKLKDFSIEEKVY